MQTNDENGHGHEIRRITPLPADHPNLRWSRQDRGFSVEPDWRRGISKPHRVVRCPQCCGLSHRRGRHYNQDEIRAHLAQRERNRPGKDLTGTRQE